MSIEKIQVLGTGCPKCQKLEENARAAIQELGLDIAVEKVTDIAQIARMGVMMTPALAVDGNVAPLINHWVVFEIPGIGFHPQRLELRRQIRKLGRRPHALVSLCSGPGQNQ